MAGFIVLRRLALVWLLFTVTVFGQPGLTVQPQQVSLAAPAGSASPAVQTVTVVGGGAFTASVRYLGATTGWLSVTPMSGTAPATLSISAQGSGLPAGSYLGQVTVSSGGLGAVVNVFFNVGSGSGGGSFVTDASTLTFLGQGGAAILPSQKLTVNSAKGVTDRAGFNVFASSSGNWLSVSPSAGTTPASLTVVAVQSGLRAGTHTGTITITPAGGGNPTIVPVTLTAAGVGEPNRTLTLTQTAVNIRYQTGGSIPPLQVVSVVPAGGASEFTASTTTPWVRLVSDFNTTPAMSVLGLAPSDFGVLIEPAGLVTGVHVGVITVMGPGVPAEQLSVTLTISNGTALNANPSSLLFDEVVGIDGAFVTITSTGSANVSFTTAVSPAVSWLSVTPASGSTSGGSEDLTVLPNITGLAPGVYTTSIVLTVQGSGATFSIPVRLNISGSATDTGTLEVSPTSVELTTIVGGPNPSQFIDVGLLDASKNHNFTAAATSASGWLSVEPFSGTLPARIRVTANAAAVSGPGTYQGFITITSLLTGEQRAVTVSFTLAARAIAAAPNSLNFVQEQRGVAPPAQSLQITANTPSTFAVGDLPPWIKVNPTQGSAPATLTVWVEISLLPPGTNGGRILVTGPNNQLSIPVSVTTPEPAAPTATPETVTFAHQLGGRGPAPQDIMIGSTAEAIRFTATAKTESGVRWLNVSPASGTTPAAVSASVDISQLVPGRHSGTITIATADGSIQKSIGVTLTVSAAPLVVQGLLNAATLTPSPIAPGEIVTITGSGLGPVTGVAARPSAAGAFESRLSDVRVLFDGVAAPLLFVRNDQINAIVPYAMHGRFSARIQVESGTSFSVPIEARVVDSAPGVFTATGTGKGQIAALNSDLTVNSLANPAERGGIVTIFGTGEGQTDPAGQDGRVISTDLRRPLLPIVVRIGGRTAEVLYAGSASGLVSGIFQANIRVPEDIAAGAVPLEIQIGGAAIQTGATIAVR
jgi:uncharacterized protein (TIGR03437 family)